MTQLPLLPPRLTPQRKIGSPSGKIAEEAARDEALDNLAAYRGALCETGREVAVELCKQRGRITSVEVFAEMRARGYDEALNSADPRWMGVVFREEIWERQGWEQTGSHRRPVAIWRLVDPARVPLSPRTIVYQTIAAAAERGATDEEILLATNLNASAIRAQLKDLADGQLISRSSVRRKRTSGRKADVWFLPIHDPEIV